MRILRYFAFFFAVIPSTAFAFCPFCPPATATLSEKVAEADAVALASLVSSQTKKEGDVSTAVSTWKIVSILKNFRETFSTEKEIKIAEAAAGKPGDLFLLRGIAEGREAAVLTWEKPLAISEIGFQYLKQAPAPETPKRERLRYFLKFLEYPDPLLADDAYWEFAAADYADLVLIKDAFDREKIRKWIEDPKTLASRLGLYGLMLGLSGNDSDAELLKAKILDDADDTRLGIDGIIGGYLLLTGEEGMSLLEEKIIKNPNSPTADVHAVMSAFRFLWEYEEQAVGKDRLKRAMRLLIERNDVADLAIADLARWKDWSVQDRLMEIYKKGDPSSPLGQIAIRRAVIRYMIASTLDRPEDENSVPAHVKKGQEHLETLRELDPKGVLRAERFMLPSKSPRD